MTSAFDSKVCIIQIITGTKAGISTDIDTDLYLMVFS